MIMRPSANITNWQSDKQLFVWLKQSADEETFKRRLVIWLTNKNRLHAKKIAELLDISIQSVWLWTNQYNRRGPDGLDRQGRGGRRWGFLSPQQEAEFLQPFVEKIKSGEIITTVEIKESLESQIGKQVSLPYVYRLLSRHNWYEFLIRTKPLRKQAASKQTDFRKISQPWLRK